MNANELADELEKSIYEQIANINFHDVAEFIRKQDSSIDKHILAEENLREYVVFQGKQIRQQQAEIEALKAEVIMHRTNSEKLTMRLIDCVVKPPTNELTDEEIWKEFLDWQEGRIDDDFLIGKGALFSFARAILRKAQEK